MADSAQAQMPPMPPLLVESFNWETSKTDASVHQRRANGAEAIVGIEKSNAAGANDLYLISSVQFADSGLTLSELQKKVERALVKQRYEHPEIAQTCLWEEGQHTPWIQYQSPKSNEEALAWAQQLVNIRASSQSGLDVRTEIEIKRHQEASGPAKSLTVDIIAPVSGLDAPLGSVNVEFVFHTNHLYFDGISKRILVGDFFRILGEEVSSSATGKLPDFKWGEETKNLAVPALTLLKDGVQTTGPEFDGVMGQYVGTVMRGMHNYGLKPKPDFGLPRVIFHTFTKEESEAIYKAVKSKIGSSASPAHLGHAAVFLALLKANPPSADVSDSQIYMAQSPMNGRRWLKDTEQHAKTFYPCVQASCPVIYENIKQYNVVDAPKETIDEYLVQATKNAKEKYEQWLSNPMTLPVGTAFHNFVTLLLASGSIPETGITAPMFTSDGINETYIDREITDKAGNATLTVNTVRFFLNQYMTFMSIRLDSFRGRSELSLSYNDGQYTDKEASDFLKDTAALMLQFAQ